MYVFILPFERRTRRFRERDTAVPVMVSTSVRGGGIPSLSFFDRRNDMSVMAKKVLCIGGGLFGIIICAFGFLVSMVDSDSHTAHPFLVQLGWILGFAISLWLLMKGFWLSTQSFDR